MLIAQDHSERANTSTEAPADILLTAVEWNQGLMDTLNGEYAASAQAGEIVNYKNKKENKNSGFAPNDFNFGAKEEDFSSNTWIGDSGASCHMTNDDTGMEEIRHIEEEITIGNGKPMKATKVGRVKVELVQKDGTTRQFTMENVKYVPELYCKLFSLTTALDKGFQIGNVGRVINLRKGNFQIAFDKVFETKTGFISGVDIIQRNNSLAQAALDAGKEVNINDFHQRIGHPSEEIVRKTAENLGLKLTGKFIKCENCAISKARRKNVNKQIAERSSRKGDRFFIDISSINSESVSGRKYWLLVVDDNSDFCFSYFLKSKDELSETMIDLIRELKATKNIVVKAIRCDNAGENKAFERDAKKKGLGLIFEYTAPATPQQNGRVERKYAALYGRVRAMLNGARITSEMRKKLWAECARTATACENLIVGGNQTESSYKLFHGELPKYARHLRTFGEIAIITDNQKIKGKLDDRGKACMFLGYSETHTGDTYRFLNMKTWKSIMSRDIIWLKKNYSEWKGIKSVNTTRIEEDDMSDEEEPAEVISNQGVNVNADETTTPVPRIIRELRGLQFNTGWGNPTADEELNRLENSGTGREITNVVFPNSYSFLARETLLHTVETGQVNATYEEPKNFQQAWNHEDTNQREKWRTAIKKEFADMNNRNVWRNYKRHDLPHNRRCVKCKWVFKIKRNGVFRARLVACGYTQVPGIDFTENYAPVINDVTWRILIVAMLLWNLEGILIDVECAFLEGELEEEVYMNCPEGLEGVDDSIDCLRLNKSIYGLVQSARQWWKKFVKILRELGFDGGRADPCLFSKKDSDGIIFIALYVDDCLCIGDKKAIKNLVDSLKNRELKLKVDDELRDYLSCEIHFSRDRKRVILHQEHIIRGIAREFEDEVKHLQNYRTPGTPGIGMIRDPDGVSVSAEEQSRFRMGIGKLLYLVKHTRPDIANAVRELSKMLDCTNQAAIKEMRRVIKYVLDTRDYGLKIDPVLQGTNGFFDLQTYCDSDFAGDKETRISVAGYVMYLCGAPISWRSKAMKHVTLSSSEAEYVSLSEAAKEVKFIVQLIESMGIDVEKPVVIRVDNIGAIFMANNVTTSPRTKHIDVRYRYVTEFIDNGLVTIKFVKTEENDSDGFTKNLSGDLHEKHQMKMMGDKREVEIIRKIEMREF